jgi:hypothetical protein
MENPTLTILNEYKCEYDNIEEKQNKKERERVHSSKKKKLRLFSKVIKKKKLFSKIIQRVEKR